MDADRVGARRERDSQGRAEDRIGGPEVEPRGRPASVASGFGGGDVETSRVEDQPVGGRVHALEPEGRRAAQGAFLEIHRQIQVHVPHEHAVGLRERMNVDGGRHGGRRLAKPANRPGR